MGDSCSSVKFDSAVIGRVPVVSASGMRLMPCKPLKAKKLLEAGKAEDRSEPDWSNTVEMLLRKGVRAYRKHTSGKKEFW